MKRRSFFSVLSAAGLGLYVGACSGDTTKVKSKDNGKSSGTFSIDRNQIRFYNDMIQSPVSVLQISDTHLWMDDERGEAFREYSKRMAGAYHSPRHFSTNEVTSPVQSFEESLLLAKEQNVDLIALTGDIFSFPSEAAIEWAHNKLEASGIPYLYIAGNHDWHYEGMEGSSKDLRDTWTQKRLTPLYQGNHPLMAAYKVKGITFLAIDNSTYEILPEQLEFFRAHVKTGVPLVLMMHIPLYAPGRNVGFGCGHPEWGAETDGGYKIERRMKWPERGHSETTMDFHREVFAAPNLLGVFAGHTHSQSLDVVNGIPQIVADDNASGAYLTIDFLPGME